MFTKQTRVGDFDWGRPVNLPESKYELDNDQIDTATLAFRCIGGYEGSSI